MPLDHRAHRACKGPQGLVWAALVPQEPLGRQDTTVPQAPLGSEGKQAQLDPWVGPQGHRVPEVTRDPRASVVPQVDQATQAPLDLLVGPQAPREKPALSQAHQGHRGSEASRVLPAW